MHAAAAAVAAAAGLVWQSGLTRGHSAVPRYTPRYKQATDKRRLLAKVSQFSAESAETGIGPSLMDDSSSIGHERLACQSRWTMQQEDKLRLPGARNDGWPSHLEMFPPRPLLSSSHPQKRCSAAQQPGWSSSAATHTRVRIAVQGYLAVWVPKVPSSLGRHGRIP